MSAAQLVQIPVEFKAIAAVLPISNHAKDNGMTVNGRQLHEALEVKSYYTTWIQRAIKGARLVEGEDYFAAEEVSSTSEINLAGGRPNKEFFFTLDAAKHFAIMCKSEKGKLAREYLILLENLWRAGTLPPASADMRIPQPKPSYPADLQGALQMLAQGTLFTAEKLTQLEARMDSKEEAIYLVKAETKDQFGEQTLTQPQQEQILDAIDARLVSLGINKSKKVFGHLPVKACVLAELKRAFFKTRRSEFTYKNLMQNQLTTALTFIGNWTPDAQLASALAPKIK